MRKGSLEFKVGLFLLIGLLSLLYLTLRVKDLQSWREGGYTLYGYATDVTGLNPGSKVKMQGVAIGYLKGFELNGTKVLLTLAIQPGIKIPKDSNLTLGQDTMLGGRYIRIIPSQNPDFYPPGATIPNFTPSASIETVLNNVNGAVSQIRTLLTKIDKTLDKTTLNNLKTTIANIKDGSENLKELLATLNQKVPNVVDNLNRVLNHADYLVGTYTKTGQILNQKLPSILENANRLIGTLDRNVTSLAGEYKKVGENINSILTENKGEIKGAIVSAKEFFAEGGKSFKKLDKFLGSVTKSVLDVEIGGGYFTKDKFARTEATLTYIPRPTKYYIFSVINSRDYSSWQKVATDNKDRFLISAQLGKRYGNWLLRGGIIENTGGVGMDYFAFKDSLKLSGELFDFNGDNDVRGTHPHMRVAGRYLFLKHLYLQTGVDNLLNPKTRNFFVGAGIKFQDNDLKTIAVGGASSLLK